MNSIRIGFWSRIAFFFLVRSGRATAALSIMVITAVAVLIFLSALAVGVKDAMLRNTVGLFSGHITGYNLKNLIMTKDLKIEGVESVLRRFYLQGVISDRDLSLPLVVCGIDSVLEIDQTSLPQKLLEGRYPLAGQREILISRTIADVLGVHTGDTLNFTFRPESRSLVFSVSGIFQSGMDMLDRGIAFIPLNLAFLKKKPWSAAIFIKTGIDQEHVMQIYRQRFPAPARFDSWEVQMPDLKQLIDLEAVSMVIVILLVFGVVAIGIACSFVIFIIQNMREYGILKAMGVTTTEMSLLIVAKVVLMNILACATGLLIGLIAVLAVANLGGIDISRFTSHNQYFSVSGVILPRLTMFSLWAPPATAMLFSLLAAFWPAAMVARKKAADILRMV